MEYCQKTLGDDRHVREAAAPLHPREDPRPAGVRPKVGALAVLARRLFQVRLAGPRERRVDPQQNTHAQRDAERHGGDEDEAASMLRTSVSVSKTLHVLEQLSGYDPGRLQLWTPG